MRFDPKTSFDAEAYWAIKPVLPSGANVDAFFLQLEDVALDYHQPRRRPAKLRERLERRLGLLDKLGTDLRDERRHPLLRDDGGAPLRALEGIAVMRAHAEQLLETLEPGRRGQDVRRKMLYTALLRIWTDAGGALTTGNAETGSPCAQYLAAAVGAITGKPFAVGGTRKAIRRQLHRGSRKSRKPRNSGRSRGR